VANCDAAREALLTAEGPRPDSVVVLENGVDLERFDGLPPPLSPPRRIGIIANLRAVKGLDVLIDAAAAVLPRFPDASVEVAGEGPERAALLERARGLGGRFRLLGSVGDVPRFLGGIDIAVSSSRAEGMSNAVLEYMAAGRPVVATAVGANPRLLGGHGLLVPPDDASALASAITHLLEHPGDAARMGEAGRRRAAREYSRAAMLRRFEQFYEGLVFGQAEEGKAASGFREEDR
jgi:glycosyltransferase involved in cell wall biosynthesis